MSGEWFEIGVTVLVLLVALGLGVRVGLALLFAGMTGIVLVDGFSTIQTVVGGRLLTATSSFTLTVVPMFVLMGYLLNRTRLPNDIFSAMSRASDRFPGMPGLASIGACAGLGAVTGASITGITAIGPMAIQEMRRHGYSRELAGGLIASAGTLGILIPPSIAVVIYSIIVSIPVGPALLGGIIPGVLTAITYGVLTMYLASRSVRRHAGEQAAAAPMHTTDSVDGEHTGAGASTTVVADKVQAPAESTIVDERSSRRGLLAVLQVAALFTIVIGGIYSGLTTVTESAAIGAAAAVMLVVWAGRRDGARGLLGRVSSALAEATSATSMIFLLIIGGSVFTYFLVISRAASAFSTWAAGLPLPSWTVVVIILFGMLVLGMFLDGLSILLITIPLTAPLIVGTYGYDPIWFGILAIKTIEIGLVTPPLGINAYVVSGVVPDMPAESVFRGALPFIGADLVVIALIMIFPATVTWLPAQMAT